MIKKNSIDDKAVNSGVEKIMGRKLPSTELYDEKDRILNRHVVFGKYQFAFTGNNCAEAFGVNSNRCSACDRW
jgi:hypothetical protein